MTSTFKCPNCGGPMALDREHGQVTIWCGVSECRNQHTGFVSQQTTNDGGTGATEAEAYRDLVRKLTDEEEES